MKTKPLLLFSIIVLSLFSFIQFYGAHASGENWLTGWGYRKSHIIINSTGAGTNYPVCIEVYKSTGADSSEILNTDLAGVVYVGTNCRDDFGDLRFTSSDGMTLLDYWQESTTSGVKANFWIEISDSLTSTNQTIYVYYGNSAVTSISNGNKTFIYYDDFEGSGFNTTIWDTVAGMTTDFTYAYQGLKSAKNTGYNTYAINSYPLLTTNTKASVWNFDIIQASATSLLGVNFASGYMYLGQRDGQSTTKFSYRHDSATWVTGTTSRTATWTKIQVLQTSTGHYGYVNNNTEITHASASNAITNIVLGDAVGSASTGSNWQDCYYQRKCIASEPTHGIWGLEEGSYAIIYFNHNSTEGCSVYLNTVLCANATAYHTFDFTIFAVVNGTGLYIFQNFTYVEWSNSTDLNPDTHTLTNINITIWVYFILKAGEGAPFIYARFTFNDSAPYQVQDTVFFNASLSNCSSLPLTYYWDFGDLDTSTGETTTHIYLNSGVFIVNLTVVNGAMSDTLLQNITVFATTITLQVDWNDLLFGSGAWLPFIAIMIVMFVGVAINKWFVVAALPIMALMSFLYFDHITTTPSLVWEALIMMCSAIVLLLYSASKK